MLNHNRRSVMSVFFGQLDKFEVEADEEIAITAISRPETLEMDNVQPFVARFPNVRQAADVALMEIGPDCELFVAIVGRDGNRIPDPVNVKSIIGSWELRERTSREADLANPVYWLRGPASPKLHLLFLYPVGNHHVYQATIHLDEQRYRRDAGLDLFGTLDALIEPF